MTTALDLWLKQATRRLADDSATHVRAEIQEHYECAREAALAGGASIEEADRLALAALGDAKTANRQYRRVLLTSAEAKLLREGSFEAQFFCSRPLQWFLVVLVAAAMFASAILFLTGRTVIARGAFSVGIVFTPFLVPALLPINTPRRGLAFRCLRWVAITAPFALVLGADAVHWSWMIITPLWMQASHEWTRASIRRKLPLDQWPRHLYL